MSDSYVEYSMSRKEAVSYVGPDATELFRVNMIKVCLRMWRDTKMIPTRGMTITKMLAQCERYTGKKYKRTQVQEAINDMDYWVKLMVSAIPLKEIE